MRVFKHKYNKGITLVEIMATIGIMATLAVLLFPSLEKAQRSAADMKTGARMKILAAGYALYMSEHNQQVVFRGDGKLAAATTGDNTLALAPYLSLPETGGERYACPVWWDGMAEKNGTRNKDNTEGDLYYPDPPAWPGGPPRAKLTGMYFNPYAHQLDSANPDSHAFESLGQLATPSRTALLLSRRRDSSKNAYNSWSDGRKFSSSNPASIGAKRMIMYFDGHMETVNISGQDYQSLPKSAEEVRPEYLNAEPVFYAWPST